MPRERKDEEREYTDTEILDWLQAHAGDIGSYLDDDEEEFWRVNGVAGDTLREAAEKAMDAEEKSNG